MRKPWLILALSVLLVPVLGRAASAQTADDVVNKVLTALGGRDALAKITSRRAIGTITVSTPNGDLNGTAEIDSKPPNKSRTHLEIDLTPVGMPDKLVVDQRFDGTNGSSSDSMRGDIQLTANQLQNARNNVFPTSLLSYKEHGITMELLPKETVGDKSYLVLKSTPKEGSPVKMYIDPDTYLPARTVSTVEMVDTGAVEQTSDLSDYRVVAGVKVPFKLSNSNALQSATFTFKTIEHNVDLPDSLFSKPGAPIVR
jgi:outer membrane lipoprotein-sorting protein